MTATRQANARFRPIADIRDELLASCMKVAVPAALIILASCAQQSDVSCPSIELLAQRDAAADARTALAKDDHHLLMIGGFVSEVPGVADSGAYPTRMIEGTSDFTTEACMHQRGVAEAYATKYNQTVVEPH